MTPLAISALSSAHQFDNHAEPDCRKGGCDVCRIGALRCLACNGRDEDLTTDCPGINVTADHRASIVMGELDFRAGTWISYENADNSWRSANSLEASFG